MNAASQRAAELIPGGIFGSHGYPEGMDFVASRGEGALIFTTDAFCQFFHINIGEQPIVDLFRNTHSPALKIILLLFALSVAPVFEEFLFRGFAYPALKQRFGLWRALLLVSLVFALSHFHAPSFLPLFVFAFGLGLAYELTGSLLAPITMHALFNATMILQIFYQRSHS